MSKKTPKPTFESVRHEILEILTDAGDNYQKTNELSRAIGIRATSSDYDLVRQALESLEEEGLIFRASHRRYGRKVPNVLIDGVLQNIGGGRWRVTSQEDPSTVFAVDSRLLWTAFHGDLVRAKMVVAPREGEIAQAEVVKLLDRRTDTFVGTLKQGHDIYLDCDDRKMYTTITIGRRHTGGARIGDKVVVKLLKWDHPDTDPFGEVVERLGRAGEMNAEIASIAAQFRLPSVFPKEALAEADAFESAVLPADIKSRRDLRDMAIITIDPADARDFDDAISIEEHEDGDVTVGIHIADVSHFVREGTPLDLEAYRRGTSVYLVTGVIPMLPERLSNDLCSLRPGEDRLAYSCFVRLSVRGAIRDYEIVKSVIHSKRRFTYEEALDVLETGTGDYAHELLALNKIAHLLRAQRHRKGSIDFDRAELKFRLDEKNHPVEVMQKRATESTRLIEDLMLLANRVVATHIGKEKRKNAPRNPFIYRIHDVPPKEKLLELANFVKGLGYSLPVDNVQPKDIQKLISDAKGSDEEELVKEMTLRSMAKAVYSDFNIGHFGLAFTHYTHFTSPIRRYPDLIVHRLLNEYAGGMPGDRRQYYAGALGEIARYTSERERAAVEAERESIKVAQVKFLKDHVGDVFEASISGVMPFGIFAQLKKFGIEGLVRMRSMSDDFYVYDESRRAFRGRRTGRVYRLGDKIHVRVMRVDETEGQIDMELIEEEEFLAGEERNGNALRKGKIPRVEEETWEPLPRKKRRSGVAASVPKPAKDAEKPGRKKAAQKASDTTKGKSRRSASAPKPKGRTTTPKTKDKGKRKR